MAHTERGPNARKSDDDDDSSTSSDISATLANPAKEDEWQDVDPEEDIERLEYVSLVDGKTSVPSLDDLLDQAREAWGIDLRKVVQGFGLDFYGCVKLVNFVREEVSNGNTEAVRDLKTKEVFEDERYLQPFLQDDAVLFSLDEVIGQPDVANGVDTAREDGPSGDDVRVKELEEQLSLLQSQFQEYKLAVERTLDKRWSGAGEETTTGGSSSGGSGNDTASKENKSSKRDIDSPYFESYSYSDIHEIMLKDTVRTSTYRDFIYANKNIFASRTVLDIGCGTGILSLFAAKAGAKKVIAVDNSAIITKAREIIAENNLFDTITCVRGKIEDVPLPLKHDPTSGEEKVDILVSEWMGYGLLYEAMLPSVLTARDRYLAPETGIMAPSHCTLHIAPFADQDYVADTFGFWADVYGFDMSVMAEKSYDDVIARFVKPACVPASSARFRTLDLYAVTTDDLDFRSNFRFILDRDIDALDGFVIWFDTFFLPSRDAKLPEDARAETWPGKDTQDVGVAFTTGPYGEETHWKTCVLMINRMKKRKGAGKQQPVALKAGQKIEGTVSYRKGETNERELEIEVSWRAEGAEEAGSQLWYSR